MKRALFLTLAMLGLLSTAQAEITESNIVIQAKIYTQLLNTEVNNVQKYNYRTENYRTIDFIKRIATAQRIPAFSNQARLIYQVTNRAGNPPLIKVLIRDKGRPDYETITPLTLLSLSSSVAKGGIHTETQLGNVIDFRHGTCRLQPDSTETELEFSGLYQQNIRIAQSKDFDGFYNITTVSLKGVGLYDYRNFASDADYGHCQGSIKYTTPKIIRTPAP